MADYQGIVIREADLPGGRGLITIVPPGDWRRDEIVLDGMVPPSMNTNKIRSHWRGFHTEKKKWEQRIQTELMVIGLPRGNQRAIAGARLRFPKRAARRDAGNFQGIIEKALGDALAYRLDPIDRRYIPDDDAVRYFFTGVEFEEEVGPARTTIVLFTQPKE